MSRKKYFKYSIFGGWINVWIVINKTIKCCAPRAELLWFFGVILLIIFKSLSSILQLTEFFKQCIHDFFAVLLWFCFELRDKISNKRKCEMLDFPMWGDLYSWKIDMYWKIWFFKNNYCFFANLSQTYSNKRLSILLLLSKYKAFQSDCMFLCEVQRG